MTLFFQCRRLHRRIHAQSGFGQIKRRRVLASADKVSVDLSSQRGFFPFWRSDLLSQVGVLAASRILGKNKKEILQLHFFGSFSLKPFFMGHFCDRLDFFYFYAPWSVFHTKAILFALKSIIKESNFFLLLLDQVLEGKKYDNLCSIKWR